MQRDLKQLHGRWQIVALQSDGRYVSKFRSTVLSMRKSIFDGDNICHGRNGCVLFRENHAGSDELPEEIRRQLQRWSPRGKSVLIIRLYMLDQDQWTICISCAGI
jgi:hypothetical protein